ncbi:hypothetical protein [Acidithrix ferrooxidans]|uniref:Uncharacterized protein n=1 Tax=Acidithrix ferrooxidans TaxID=1280514 RepID=A0A0D8HK84_9ACTN|nr:hypothetical protein [Acidithrix ferrooxidans]KJF18172.1 hypothetical protein AXFE_09170 [Acidithrix ferrooxidans]
MMERVERIERAVVDQCELLLASDAFDAWKGAESIRPNDHIVFNNSFLLREGQSTIKNVHYLAIRVDENGGFLLPPIIITMKSRITSQFKRLPAKVIGEYDTADLRTAILEQLPLLGSIMFSLVGRIGDPEAAEVDLVGVSWAQVLRYSPNQISAAELLNDAIILGDITSLDSTWAAVQATAAHHEIDITALSDIFETAFHALQETVARPVDLTDIVDEAPSILSNMLVRIQQQVKAFSEALFIHRDKSDDDEVYNELLRVAYNFADGARAFLSLMVGICDLKPLIFWLTVFEQVELAHCFTKLPFSLVGKGKPSLERYRSVIADARNQAFHDLFAFDHPFKVDLAGDAFRSPKLRLFRGYGKRNDPALTFEDRGLVELLQSLTRTSEHPVPLGFWDGNQDIMNAVVDAVGALRRALVVVAE